MDFPNQILSIPTILWQGWYETISPTLEQPEIIEENCGESKGFTDVPKIWVRELVCHQTPDDWKS